MMKLHEYVKELTSLIKNKKVVTTGPQLSTLFKTEVLERVDINIISPLASKDSNALKQVEAYLKSPDFRVDRLGAFMESVNATPSCVGSNETGRVFSQAWILRMTDLEKDIGYDLKQSIYALWLTYCGVFKEDKKESKSSLRIAELEKENAELKGN